MIARPQNQHSGHLKYSKDDPIFITTLEADIMSLKGKRLQQGDIDMMLNRLKVFSFHEKFQRTGEDFPECPHCFARLLLGDQCCGKRAIDASPADAVPAKRHIKEWGVGAVQTYLQGLELGHLCDRFVDAGVDGLLLAELTEADLMQDLGCSKIQARKIQSRLPF